jgi:hypothetical protein
MFNLKAIFLKISQKNKQDFICLSSVLINQSNTNIKPQQFLASSADKKNLDS